MLPTVCQCCGEVMGAPRRGLNPNLCGDCERLTEDESPVRAIRALACEWTDVTWERTRLSRAPSFRAA